jgi:hypothetical protein
MHVITNRPATPDPDVTVPAATVNHQREDRDVACNVAPGVSNKNAHSQ